MKIFLLIYESIFSILLFKFQQQHKHNKKLSYLCTIQYGNHKEQKAKKISSTYLNNKWERKEINCVKIIVIRHFIFKETCFVCAVFSISFQVLFSAFEGFKNLNFVSKLKINELFNAQYLPMHLKSSISNTWNFDYMGTNNRLNLQPPEHLRVGCKLAYS